MMKCQICKKQTKKGIPTGRFETVVYKNSKDKSEGKRILNSKATCMKCSGNVLI